MAPMNGSRITLSVAIAIGMVQLDDQQEVALQEFFGQFTIKKLAVEQVGGPSWLPGVKTQL
jgi:hypothetical protein